MGQYHDDLRLFHYKYGLYWAHFHYFQHFIAHLNLNNSNIHLHLIFSQLLQFSTSPPPTLALRARSGFGSVSKRCSLFAKIKDKKTPPKLTQNPEICNIQENLGRDQQLKPQKKFKKTQPKLFKIEGLPA